MKAPLRVRRRRDPLPATALLLPSHRGEDLLQLCGQLEARTFPEIHAVAEGFLVRLPDVTARPPLGALRLRNLASHVYLPADADLLPALLDDEAAALGRNHGLLFLPGDHVLEYDHAAPLSLADLVQKPAVARGGWLPLPDPPVLCDHLREVRLDLPEVPVDDMLMEGGEGISEEAPRPEPAIGPVAHVIGWTILPAALVMAWVGAKLGLSGLARAAEKWLDKALTLAPRLSEKILGLQEAALRALLQDFRDGKIERALRRALPLAEPGRRGGTPTTNTQLGDNDIFYSLRNLLAGASGRVGVWLGGYDVQLELAVEYRKLAEQAVQSGDFRRAAFIYAKLLGDFRAAANVLNRGGLHHDAAMVFLEKLHDAYAAAQALVAGGEFEAALKIYMDRADHAEAADVLRQLGNEEAAIAQYRMAAEKLVGKQEGHYRAGEMLLTRAKLPHLAKAYFDAGWQKRPEGASARCAIRAAELHARDGSLTSLLRLVEEADTYFAQMGHVALAVEFYNQLVKLADRAELAGVREDLRDRSLMGLANKVRERIPFEVKPADLVSRIFDSGSNWSAPVVGDALAAMRSAREESHLDSIRAKAEHRVQLPALIARVTSVCQAEESGDLFVGFESGEVVRYQPGTNVITPVEVHTQPVQALAASLTGGVVVALRQSADRSWELSSSRYAGARYERAAKLRLHCQADVTMSQELGFDEEPVVAVLQEDWLSFLDCTTLTNRSGLIISNKSFSAPMSMRVLPNEGFLVCDRTGTWVTNKVLAAKRREFWKALCSPLMPRECTLQQPPVSWFLTADNVLQIALVGDENRAEHCSFLLTEEAASLRQRRTLPGQSACLAVCHLEEDLLALVTMNSVDVMSTGEHVTVLRSSTPAIIRTAIACYVDRENKDLLVVTSDGAMVRVPVKH